MHTTDDFELNPFFTEYLDETHKRVKPFSTMGWLRWMDDDSLKMLNGYIDNLDESICSEDDINEDEVVDLCQLVTKLIQLEMADAASKGKKPDCPDHTDCIHRLVMMVCTELLRRKGFVTYKGSGKIIKDDTKIALTELGKEMKHE